MQQTVVSDLRHQVENPDNRRDGGRLEHDGHGEDHQVEEAEGGFTGESGTQ